MERLQIPKVIHQIWSGIKEPLPDGAKMLGETWKRDYPNWKYELWNNQRMNSFVQKYYPQYWNIYVSFPYDIQRWDAIRYLILYKAGGLYVDFDYESIEPMYEIISDKSCCFASEPSSHLFAFGRKFEFAFNNALMACVPEHPFIKKVLDKVFSKVTLENKDSKEVCVLNTTGPWMLTDLYQKQTEDEKKDIYLIPAKYVTPFDLFQANRFRQGEMSDELENCLKDAYAVHYFFSDWRKNDK